MKRSLLYTEALSFFSIQPPTGGLHSSLWPVVISGGLCWWWQGAEGGVAKPCSGKDIREEGWRDCRDEGGGASLIKQAMRALPSIRQCVGDLLGKSGGGGRGWYRSGRAAFRDWPAI